MKHMQEKKKQRKKTESIQENVWIGLGKDILWAAIIFMLFFYLCWPVRIVGGSMEPSYVDGDIVCVTRLTALHGSYKKGDVVIFPYEENGESRTIIKRIIATGGDHMAILPEGISINGRILEEPYAMGKTTGISDMIVPEGTVFVLGDHRESSFDSRNMGVIAEKDLKGKVMFRLFHKK